MEKIAIIGLSSLLPGAENIEQYWQNLIEKKDLKTSATEAEMGVNPHFFYDPTKGKTDKYYCLNGGYIRDFQFDSSGYKLSPELLEKLDKIYQWSLYVSKQALEDSGYLGKSSVLEKCGVILGNLSFPTRYSHHLFAPIYQQALDSALQQLLQQPSFEIEKSSDYQSPLNGMLSGYPAAIIAQALSLSAVNLCLDSACASSLYAIKLACDYLLSGKADLMLAGAVSCADPFFINMGFSIFQAYPEDGVSRPLDQSSKGLVAGEGAGMVVLKRYSDARRDGDRIYATIRGIGLSNDGKGKFVLSPNPKGQILAFERAYADAGINPNSIDYLECHATGTPIGDVTELNSMEAFFGKDNAIPLIGSVKSNFGHLLTAAGIAGLIKVILSMHKGLIPPTIGVNKPMCSDKGAISSDQIVNSTIPWPQKLPSKRAAISAFGFGGTNAHLIVESSKVDNQEATAEKFPSSVANKLAIVGMDAFFGSCKGLNDFERTIYQGKQHFIPLPLERWQGIEAQPKILKDFGFTNGEAPKGAYIQDFELDFLHFKIPPREEDRLIPQQLLMLKVAEAAITDAKITPGGNVAVIVAMGTESTLHQYRGRCDLSWQIKQSLERANISLPPEKIAELETIAKDSLHPSAQVNRYTSFIGNIMASRISALWDFSGPAFTVSAEENSVFRAIEIAQQLLSNQEVDAVVVGAVDLAGGFENVLLRHQLAPINRGVNTLSYDQNAKGWMIGEGAGAVVLKLHATAQQEQERIYAVIDAISLVQNHSNSDSQQQFLTQACEQAFTLAGVKPTDIGYLEVFGSGIAPEDDTEISGILKAYKNSQSQLSCCLGSVKANIGHTYNASGMASLIKTALCLHHRYLPATPQWSSPKTPELWHGSPFYVTTESKTWFLEAGVSKRIAAINGLGKDSSYAHLILSEELSQQQRPNKYLEQTPFSLFPITANDQSALLTQLNSLQNVIENSDSLLLAAAQNFRVFNQHRQSSYTLVIVGSNQEELLREISLAITGINKAFETKGEWKTPLGSYFTAKPLGSQGKVAFVYPGMGSSELGLGRDIFQLFPQVYNSFLNLTPCAGEVMHEKLLYPRSLEKPSPQLQKAKVAEFFGDGVAMTQTSISLAVLHTLILREYFQVQPQMAFGYSLGEASSMLFALGVWRDDHKLSKVLASSPLFKTSLCGPCLAGRKFWELPPTLENANGKSGDKSADKFWISYILKASVSAVKEAIQHQEKVYITFINTLKEVVIGGEPKSCLRVIATLKCQYFPIIFDSVLHCEIAESEYEGLVKLHSIPIQNIPDIEFYSGIDCAPLELDTNNLAHNGAKLCCRTVNFPKLVNRVYEDGARIFIELGAGNNCSRWIGDNLKQKEHLAIPINSKGVDDHTGVVRVLAKLASHGVSVDLSPLYCQVAENSLPRQSSLKKVSLGGCRIHATILSAANRQSFENQIMPNSPLPINTPQFSMTDSQQQTLKIVQLQIGACEQLPSKDMPSQDNSVNSQITPVVPHSTANPGTKNSEVVWDEADLLEFAEGKISRVFGKDYDVIDSYSRRVRLPLPPYLLVSRITKLEAEPGSYKPSAITTEYDIPNNSRYALDGQVPWAITVESGQCDLLLISYLGIDFENKGDLVYRLLDCTLTFLDDLPKEGDTLRYDIKINSFVKHGENLLFFFSYECFVGEKMILKMDGGCAGFFSDQQLEQGKGVVFSDKELQERSQIQKQKFEAFLICQKSTFDEEDMLHLCEGNIAECFGDHYQQYGLNPSLRLPPKAILMIDRVTSIEPTGGAWGLGLIVGEKILDPEHWYFPCHFKDDQVMAGSLMAEGCGQLLQFYLIYLGLHTCTVDARFQPIPGLPQVVRCRGQVTPISAKLIYRMEITEIGTTPKPYAKCNVEIILNGKMVVHFQDLGLQLSEKNPNNTVAVKYQAQSLPAKPRKTDVLLNEEQIAEFCLGSVAKCFGPEYEMYDKGVKASRMPNTHLNFVHRVLEVKGKRHQLTENSTIVTEYDTPADPWYCRQNSSPTIPYSILMEIALQPCGFLSAYLGTTLLYPEQDLYFRNLDGKGNLIKDIDIRGKTITNTARLLSSSNIQGVIIQSFDFQMSCEGEVFYEGDAAFGHFSPQALANQVGLDRGKYLQPWYETKNPTGLPEIQINLQSPDSRLRLYQSNKNKPHYHLASHQLDLLNEVKIIQGGGNYNQGYIHAKKQVKPTDWYFKCHFHLDPVMPGSLGIEAILQAMQVYALELNLGKHLQSPRFVQLAEHQIVWKYRGQIPHGQNEMYLEVHISKIESTPDKVTIIGDASLWKPNLRIYEVKDAAICLVESKLESKQKSLIELYQAPPCWGLPSLSPFCIKMHTYFRLAKLPYKVSSDLGIKDAPKGKLPFIKYNGQVIGDSNLIIEYLNQELGNNLDQGLSKAEQAVSLALRRMLEENLYWCAIYSRSAIESNWQLYKSVLGELLMSGFPENKRNQYLDNKNEEWYEKMRGHGIGAHSAEEIYEIGKRDLSALSDYLENKPYLMGSKATTLDAVAYGILAYIIDVPFESPLKQHALELGNLKPYCDRLKAELFTDEETKAWQTQPQ